jgi:hypothetical protein
MFESPDTTRPRRSVNSSNAAITDAQLLRQIEKALYAGRVVTVANTTVRFCKRGEQFSEGDLQYQALVSGVFLRLSVFEAGRSLPDSPTRMTWGYCVPVCELDALIGPSLEKLRPKEREGLSVDLAFTAVLAAFRADQASRRNAPRNTDETGYVPTAP